MNLFNRAFNNSLRRRKSSGKSKRKSRTPAASPKSRSKSKSRSSQASRTVPWLIGLAVVVIVAGVGLLKWAKTGSGQATLLSLGSDKMFS